jgi:histidyl-tRNA synthetase
MNIAKKLKGFPDFFAPDIKLREYVINIFKEVFEKYGYEPLETPALELTEMMIGISGNEAEKQFYRFTDSGGRDVMLKYEVMTAMCRAVAENINNIAFPYKRYQIQKVWRAENTQKGRYREFTQCDADTIGIKSVFCDAEFIQMGLEIVEKLGFDKYIARISNRKFLNGVAKYLNISDEMFYGFCMSLDKLKKIGDEKVISEMVGKGIDESVAKQALGLLTEPLNKKMSYEESLKYFQDTVGSTEVGKEALKELEDVNKYLQDAKVDSKLYMFDPSLARGLASYTGPVWEFEVIDGGVGSIAGCGRYDNVIGKYIGRNIPATGGSFGIERVCDILKERNMINIDTSPAKIMVTLFNDNLLKEVIDIANTLRKAGNSVMVYPEAANFKNQIKYADTKKIPFIVIFGSDEKEKGIVKIKDMVKREEREIKLQDLENLKL